eukprot:714695_1
MSLSLLYLVVFTIYRVYSGEPSVDLINIKSPTKIAFYDFDKTLAIESFGGAILKICQAPPENNTCDGKDALIDAFYSLPDPLLRTKIAFGNDTRINRLKLHLERVLGDDSTVEDGNIYVLTTSWEPVPAEYWADLVYEMLKIINFDIYFPREHILALDDPGPGIQADKGAVAKNKMDEVGITEMSACIFLDDKQGNLNFANCDGTDPVGASCDDYGGNRHICDTLLIQERLGLDGTDKNYIEARTLMISDTTSNTNSDSNSNSNSDSDSESGDQARSMGERGDNGKEVDDKYNVKTKVGLRNIVYIWSGVIGLILIMAISYWCYCGYKRKMKLMSEIKEQFVNDNEVELEGKNENIEIQMQ